MNSWGINLIEWDKHVQNKIGKKSKIGKEVSLTGAGLTKCVFMFLGDIGFVGRPGSPGEDAFGEC